jgi:hypothetical protein
MNTSQLLNFDPPEAPFLSIPLGFAAHDWAEQQCQGESTGSAYQAKYLRSLALYALHRYFVYLGIATDLADGDSQQQYLPIPAANARKLAWAIVQEDEEQATMANAQLTAIGCVVLLVPGDVAINGVEALSELRLLGFTPTLAPKISLNALQSIDTMLDQIHQAAPVRVITGTKAWTAIDEMVALITRLSLPITFQDIEQCFASLVDDAESATRLMNWLRPELAYDRSKAPSLPSRGQKQISQEEEQQIIRRLQVLCYDLADYWPDSI